MGAHYRSRSFVRLADVPTKGGRTKGLNFASWWTGYLVGSFDDALVKQCDGFEPASATSLATKTAPCNSLGLPRGK